ncbi:DNA integration [Vibrio sp. B1FLJ16]|nr:DNA integration [Vibrio sp. B1FLJ16]CAE6906200.1 DNA integration [Vibrio sp. B1FLJ16]
MAQFSSKPSTIRECTYLVRSKTGVYSFRWNVSENNRYRQVKLSLKTRNYLTALNLASSLALKITELSEPTLSDVALLLNSEIRHTYSIVLNS